MLSVWSLPGLAWLSVSNPSSVHVQSWDPQGKLRWCEGHQPTHQEQTRGRTKSVYGIDAATGDPRVMQVRLRKGGDVASWRTESPGRTPRTLGDEGVRSLAVSRRDQENRGFSGDGARSSQGRGAGRAAGARWGPGSSRFRGATRCSHSSGRLAGGPARWRAAGRPPRAPGTLGFRGAQTRSLPEAE